MAKWKTQKRIMIWLLVILLSATILVSPSMAEDTILETSYEEMEESMLSDPVAEEEMEESVLYDPLAEEEIEESVLYDPAEEIEESGSGEMPESEEELRRLYDREDGLVVFEKTRGLIPEVDGISLQESTYTPSPVGMSNPISGITINWPVRWTGMDAWWPNRNGAITFDENWSRFFAHKISQLKRGDVIEWKDDEQYGGLYTNHIAIVTYVAEDNSYFVTADGNAGGETGVSFLYHYDMTKWHSTSGTVNIWRNAVNAEYIANSVSDYADTIIRNKDMSLYNYYWNNLGINWCYCFVVEALLQTNVLKYSKPELNPCVSLKNGIRVSWNMVPGADKYCVFVKNTSTGKWEKIATVKDTFYDFKEIKRGRKYIFTVAAKGAAGSSRRDQEGVVGLCLKGVLPVAKKENKAIVLSYEPVSHADGYGIWRSVDGKNWKKIADIKETAYRDRSFVAGQTNSYLVRAYEIHQGKKYYGYQDKTGLTASVTVPDTPEIISASSGKGAIILKYTEEENVLRYNIFRKEAGKTFKKIGSSKEPSYHDRDIRVGVEYTYKVSVTSREKVSGEKSEESVKAVYVPFTGITKIRNTKKGVRLEWNKVGSATGFKIFRRANGGSWQEICKIKKVTTYIDDTAKEGTAYEYFVRAFRKQNGQVYWSCRAESAIRSVTAAETLESGELKSVDSQTAEAPKLDAIKTRVRQTSYGARIYWKAATSEGTYCVYRRVPGGSWKRLASGVAKTAYADKTAEKGIAYEYAVRVFVSVDGKNYISPYTEKSIAKITLLDQPEGIKMKTTADGLKVSWNEVPGADCYHIYYWATSDESWHLLQTVEGTAYTHKKAKTGTRYIFTVSALCGKNESTRSDTGCIGVYLPQPELNRIKSSKNGTRISWLKVDKATGYMVYRKTKDGKWKKLGRTSERTFLDKTGEYGTDYTYTVKAYRKINGKSYFGMYDKKGLTDRYIRDNTPKVTIMLDPGHCNRHGGCFRGTFKEYVMTLKIAKACKAELEKYRGVTVYLTRDTDACPYPDSSDTGEDIMHRVIDAANKKCDAYVSLHINAVGGGQRGVMIIPQVPTWKPALSKESLDLGTSIKKELMALGLGDNGVYYRYSTTGEKYPDGSTPDYYAVTYFGKYYDIPSLIMEHGYIDNEDFEFMNTDAKLATLGRADAAGIAAYYGLKK